MWVLYFAWWTLLSCALLCLSPLSWCAWERVTYRLRSWMLLLLFVLDVVVATVVIGGSPVSGRRVLSTCRVDVGGTCSSGQHMFPAGCFPIGAVAVLAAAWAVDVVSSLGVVLHRRFFTANCLLA